MRERESVCVCVCVRVCVMVVGGGAVGRAMMQREGLQRGEWEWDDEAIGVNCGLHTADCA